MPGGSDPALGNPEPAVGDRRVDCRLPVLMKAGLSSKMEKTRQKCNTRHMSVKASNNVPGQEKWTAPQTGLSQKSMKLLASDSSWRT